MKLISTFNAESLDEITKEIVLDAVITYLSKKAVTELSETNDASIKREEPTF